MPSKCCHSIQLIKGNFPRFVENISPGGFIPATTTSILRMKLLLSFVLSCFSFWLAAQAPINDDCAGIIDLGVAPYCSAPGAYTNVNATASDIDPLFNIPACFNNNAERDVWFQFSLPNDGSITDITVSVWGDVGGNGTLKMPEMALYRGDCFQGGLSEISCVAAPLNVQEVHGDFLGLTPGETYFLRINDYSATGTPNAGTFRLCVEAYIADFNMGEAQGTQSCSGTLWDSGGASADYAGSENLTFTICPQDFHQCIEINILDYFTESGFDFLRIYEGNGVTGLLVAEFDGSGTNDQLHVSGGGCATIEFQSDAAIQNEGFHLNWQCSSEICPAPPPTPPSASTCETALSINGCSQSLPNIISLAPGMGDPTFIQDGVNAGCIANPSIDFNFAFFYFQAQANGDFSFLVKNADPSNPSDIDFNVWGPIDDVADICDFVTTNQPVRSSWTAAPSVNNPEGMTGLTNTNPYNSNAVTDAFDCGSTDTPGQGTLPTDDSFVSALPVQQGKIYVVMLDDFSGAVESADGISIDFSGSGSGVLGPVAGETVSVSDDITICVGESVSLLATGGLDYAWSPAGSLSCNECPNPIALPTQTTTYQVEIATVCALIQDSVTVSFLDLNLGPDANVCIGASFMLNEHPFPGQYAWFGSPGLNCNTCASPVFTATESGIFTIGCIVSTPFCSDTDLIRINVADGIQPQFSILSDTAICVGNTIALGGAPTPGYVYTWTSDPTGFASNAADPPPFSPTTSTKYYLKAISPSCFFQRLDSVNVTVYQLPILQVIDGASFCFGDSVVLGSTVEQPNVAYSWVPNDGSFNHVDVANPTVTPQTPGLHTYTVTASTPGCSLSRSVPVVAVDLQLSFNVEDTLLLCAGESQEIISTVSPVGAAPVLWNPIQNLLISPDGLMATVTPQINLTYSATVSVPGCSRTQKVLVKVDSLPPFLGITPLDTTVCAGATVLLKYRDNEPLYDPADFPEITFVWSPTEGQITADTLPFLYVQSTDSIVYQRIATNGGCVDTLYAAVNVIKPPEMIVLPEMSTICPDSFVVLIASAPGIEDLTWEPAATLSCEDCLMPTATPLTTTTYTLSGAYKGCEVAKSVQVVVNAAPVYQFPALLNGCSGEQITLNLVPDPSVTTYVWTSVPPSVIPPIAQPEIPLTASGIQSVTYFLEADNGCHIQDNFTIQVTGASLMVSLADTICPEAVKQINASASVGGGVYAWSNGATTQAISTMPTETTTYSVMYELNGCVFQDSVTITVQGQMPQILFPQDIALCPGDTIVLNSVETPGATYVWSSDMGGFSETTAIPAPQVLFETTVYTVIATSPDGCSVSKTLPVTVFDATLNVSEDLTTCAGEPFSLQAVGSATGSYLWMPGDIPSPAFVDTLFTAQVQDYFLQYTYGTTGNECYLFDTVTVAVLSNFNIKIVADPDSIIDLGEPVMLDAVIQPSQNETGFVFSWLENNLKPVGDTREISATPITKDSMITYTVTVVSPNGCTQVASITLPIRQPKVNYPNAFTPNGDGKNDVFALAVLVGKVTVESLEIYNRWGQKVYESTDQQAQWDGRANGEEAASDVYVYKIRWRKGDGSLTIKTGEVTLLR